MSEPAKVELGSVLRIVVGNTPDGRVEPGDLAYIDQLVVVKGFEQNIEGWLRIDTTPILERDREFGPPPTVIQLASVLEDLAAATVGDGRLSDSEVYRLGIARGLTEYLIRTYPALTTAADGTRYERER